MRRMIIRVGGSPYVHHPKNPPGVVDMLKVDIFTRHLKQVIVKDRLVEEVVFAVNLN